MGDQKTRPILFSADSIRAILDGRKTQTRRLVKPQPPTDEAVRELSGCRGVSYGLPGANDDLLWMEPTSGKWYAFGALWAIRQLGGPTSLTPYTATGEVLWVREGFAFAAALDHAKPSEVHQRAAVWYKATPTGAYCPNRPSRVSILPGPHPATQWTKRGRWRSPLYMPRWASRIDLDVLEVRVERLHAITDADAMAEGYRSRRQFRAAWDGGTANRATWASNPMVWMIRFQRRS